MKTESWHVMSDVIFVVALTTWYSLVVFGVHLCRDASLKNAILPDTFKWMGKSVCFPLSVLTHFGGYFMIVVLKAMFLSNLLAPSSNLRTDEGLLLLLLFIVTYL